MKEQQQRLLDYFTRLSEQDGQTLLRFAEFLSQNSAVASGDVAASSPTPSTAIPPPVAIPRPAQERVLDAIKRLTETYPMLDKKPLLHQTAGLVADHIMGGKPGKPVIDELENVFRRAYDDFAKHYKGE